MTAPSTSRSRSFRVGAVTCPKMFGANNLESCGRCGQGGDDGVEAEPALRTATEAVRFSDQPALLNEGGQGRSEAVEGGRGNSLASAETEVEAFQVALLVGEHFLRLKIGRASCRERV